MLVMMFMMIMIMKIQIKKMVTKKMAKKTKNIMIKVSTMMSMKMMLLMHIFFEQTICGCCW